MFNKTEKIVMAIIAAVIVAILAVVIILALNGNTAEFDVVSWTANPANPASPVKILF